MSGMSGMKKKKKLNKFTHLSERLYVRTEWTNHCTSFSKMGASLLSENKIQRCTTEK